LATTEEMIASEFAATLRLFVTTLGGRKAAHLLHFEAGCVRMFAGVRGVVVDPHGVAVVNRIASANLFSIALNKIN
jgi:hypothetical protein